MLYNPGTKTGAALNLVSAPEIGAESQRVYGSAVDLVRVATVTTDAAGAPTYLAGDPLPAGGVHLQAFVREGGRITSMDDVQLTLEVNTGTVGEFNFDFPSNAPARGAGATTVVLPVTLATDLVASGGGGLSVTAIDSPVVITGTSLPPNAEFWIVALPKAVDWIPVDCVTEKVGPPVISSTLNIECGYDPQAFTKRAVAEVQNLRITEKYKSAFAGFMQFAGARTMIRVDVLADGTELKERVVYSGVRPAPSPERGTGNDEVLSSFEGPYEKSMLFYYR